MLLLFAVIPACRSDAMGNEVLTPNQTKDNKYRKFPAVFYIRAGFYSILRPNGQSKLSPMEIFFGGCFYLHFTCTSSQVVDYQWSG